MIDDLEVRVFRSGDMLTLHIAGELDVVTAEALASHAADVAGAAELHLDVTGVAFMDVKGATGLERVVQAATLHGATVSIVGASDAQVRLLALMGLT